MPAPAITGTAIVDGLVFGSWAGGSSLVLTYSVATASSTWSYYGIGEEPDLAGYAVFNSTQAAAFVTAMELWDSYVAASFVQTDDVTDPGAIRVAITTPLADEWGYAYLPFTGTSPVIDGYAGDIWVSADADGATSDYDIGGFDFNALLHEIGHALGLTHTFEGSPPIPLAFDNYRYSVMSYTPITDQYVADFRSDGGGGIVRHFVSVNPITPMMFDIYAIQSLYGADTSTRSGNTTYTFDQSSATLQTIYDAGGIDKIDLASHTRPSVIDLRPGSFSSIDYYSKAAQIEAAVAIFGEGFRSFITTQVSLSDTWTWTDNVAIALGTSIEKVIGGSKNDRFTGNGGANDLQGRAGDDKLDGGAGGDTLSGGVGNDGLKGSAGHDTLIGGTGLDDFIFRSVVKDDSDIISDFSAADDTIWLDNAILTAVGADGALTSAAFWANTSGVAHDSGDRIIYKTTTGEIFYDPDGSGAAARILIATLTGAPALTVADFMVL
jgi:hypothetical protein